MMKKTFEVFYNSNYNSKINGLRIRYWSVIKSFIMLENRIILNLDMLTHYLDMLSLKFLL